VRDTAASGPAGPTRRDLIAVFGAAVGVRLAVVFALYAADGALGLMGEDSAPYLAMAAAFADAGARGILAGWDWLGPDTGLMPIYPWFLAGLTTIVPDAVALAAGLLQGVVDAVTCVLIAALAGRLDSRLALPAGLFAAADPTMAVMSALVYTDSLFTFGCALALFGAARWAFDGGWRAALLLGAGLGFAALTRALILPWAVAVVILLVAWLLWSGQFAWRRFGQLAAAVALFGLLLSPVIARNMERHGVLAVTSQSGAHVLFWLVPLTMEVMDGTPHAEGSALMQRRYDAAMGGLDTGDDPFVRSTGMTAFGFGQLAELGPVAVIKAWAYGAAINLAAPAVVQAPPFQRLPRTGFYATPGGSKLEKILNFLFDNDNPTYAWLMITGVVGVAAVRLVQLYGLAAGLRRGGETAAVLLLLAAWCGFVLAVNGPIAAPKYRLPMEPALAVFFAFGFDALRRRLGREPGR